MRPISLYNTRLNELPGMVARSSMREVDAGVVSPSIFTPNTSFERAYYQSGQDAVQALAFTYEYLASQALAEDAAPMGMPSLGRLTSGSAVREVAFDGTSRRVRGFGALPEDQVERANVCRTKFSQIPPEYIDAFTAFVISALIRTPGAMQERVAALFGQDISDCLLSIASADIKAQSQAESDARGKQAEPFLQWLYGKAQLSPPPAGKTYVQDAGSRWGWGVLIVIALWLSLLSRYNGDTKKVNAIIVRGLEMEDKHL